MMRRCCFRPELLILPLLLLAGPAQAQQADTTATDTTATDDPAPDTAAVDTGRAVPSDSAMAEDPLPADTAQALPETDTLAAEPAVDTTAGAARAAQRGQAREQAQAAAASWLSLTDAGQFGESWDAAAPALQEAISREQWVKRGTRVRSRLDTLESRELSRTQYRDSTRQIPGGQPVVALQYETVFSGQPVLEAVITTRQGPADWAVAGYRIVPRPETARPDSARSDSVRPDSVQAPDTTQGEVGADSTEITPDSSSAPDSLQASPRPDSTQSPSP